MSSVSATGIVKVGGCHGTQLAGGDRSSLEAGNKRGATVALVVGKPVCPKYTRLFELPPGDRERQIQDAADAAEAAGWASPEPADSRRVTSPTRDAGVSSDSLGERPGMSPDSAELVRVARSVESRHVCADSPDAHADGSVVFRKARVSPTEG